MVGSVVCFDVYDRAFAYFTGGMDPSRILSKQAIQLYNNQSMPQDDTYNGVMVHPEMPEPRIFHAATCLDASKQTNDGKRSHITQMIIVGGLATLNVDMG